MILGWRILGSCDLEFWNIIAGRKVVIGRNKAGRAITTTRLLTKEASGGGSEWWRVRLCHGGSQMRLTSGRWRQWTYHPGVIFDRRDTLCMSNIARA